jgi:predicted TIM-barrel fold metal-dependent hydrolase
VRVSNEQRQRPCPPPDPHPHPPSFAIPQGATDCHAHVFGPAERYPYQPERSYTPPDLPLFQLRGVHRVLGIERLVLVQASVHGTDNSAILDAIATDPDNLRGVAAMTEETTDRELARLRDGGIRGIRVNLVDRGGMPFRSLAALAYAAERIRDLDFHIELLVHVESCPDLKELVRTVCVPMSVGHIGYTKAADGGAQHPGFQDFLAILRDGHFWVKLTGPYRISARERPPYSDVDGIAKAVVAAAPDRVLWGSDWPHVMVAREMPNDGDLIDALAAWMPDAELRKRILVDNPARLYGFA